MHIVIPVFVDQFGLRTMFFFKNKTGGSGYGIFPAGAFSYGSQQRNEHMGPINFSVIIPNILQHFRRFDDRCRRDGNIFFSGNFYHAECAKRQVAKGHHPVRDTQLVAHIKCCGQLGAAHIERLFVCGNILSSDAAAIHIEVHIDEIESFENIADAAAAIVVVSAVEHHVFNPHRFGRRDQANHAIGHSDAIIVGRINVVCDDMPGVVLGKQPGSVNKE